MTRRGFPVGLWDLDVCHVTTKGRVSGRPHRIEIWFGMAAGTMYLISGNGREADWFLNLQAHADVLVELGGEARRATARVVADPSERRLVGEVMGVKHAGWEGDPEIGLTFEAWCFDVPAAAIEDWRQPG